MSACRVTAGRSSPATRSTPDGDGGDLRFRELCPSARGYAVQTGRGGFCMRTAAPKQTGDARLDRSTRGRLEVAVRLGRRRCEPVCSCRASSKSPRPSAPAAIVTCERQRSARHRSCPQVKEKSPAEAGLFSQVASLALINSRHRACAIAAGHTHAFGFAVLTGGGRAGGLRLILFVVEPMLALRGTVTVLIATLVTVLHRLAAKLLLALAVGGKCDGAKQTAGE